MPTYRTPEVEAAYAAWRAQRKPDEGCILCAREPVQRFTYWKIIPNDFPYGKIAKRHDMVVPLRHTTEEGFTEEEKKELYTLRKTILDDNYNFIMEATHPTKSIPDHFHLHLVTIKE